MSVVYFARHGLTDWNVARRMQGQLDIPINDTGRLQAKRNGETLAKLIENPDEWHFVASPLSRTSETMEIMREAMGLPRQGYDTDDRLKEIHFGDWQGFTKEELQEKNPEDYTIWQASRWTYVKPGEHGESYELLTKRVLDFFSEINQNTVCVSHGGVNRCLQKHFNKLSNEEASSVYVPQDQVMKIENGTIKWF